MLNACHLIACCTIVFGDLRLDDNLRIEFTGYDEIRRLVETFDSFRSFGLAETDACFGEYILNRRLQAVADEFAYGVTMPGKRSSKKPFIQQHGVGSAYSS